MPSEYADSNPTVFAIVLSIIASGEQRRFENLPPICEIEAVLKDVRLVLFIVPLKPHTMSVIARSISNKRDRRGEAGSRLAYERREIRAHRFEAKRTVLL